MNLDPRIGKFSNGKFYAFPLGYDKPEFVGSLEEVEAALGLCPMAPPAAPRQSSKIWTVTLRFQFPAWDEVGGIEYQNIEASSRAEANAAARRQAELDGHLCVGKGRLTFFATEKMKGVR